jgi:phosphoenolpyruvate carboxylase
VADSIACGHLRATEHGESVNERYGVRGIAFRTLEKAFSAVATATAGLENPAAADGIATDIMDVIAYRGDELLRELVGEDGQFERYFRLATPIDVIEQMRAGHTSLADADDEVVKRNIPWAFAWAQSRFLLPSWYGFGAGLELAMERHGVATVRELISNWPFLSRLYADVETALAIADPGIASHYSALAGDELHTRFFPVIQAEYERTFSSILLLSEQSMLLENRDTLRRSIRLRNPYVDPMSLLQVELLRRWRADERSDRALLTALIASVNGISRGLQTSG